MHQVTGARPASAALGAAAVLLGLRQTGKMKVVSVVAGGGLLAYASLAKGARKVRQAPSLQPLAITVVVTVGKPRDELYAMWRDPQVLAQIFGGALQLTNEGEGRIRANVKLPAGQEIAWTSRLVAEVKNTSLLWRTDPGVAVPHEMFVQLRDARPSAWGSEITLGLSPLSDDAATKAFLHITHAVDQAMLKQVLRRFKSLAESGEVPTLSHNPAGRHRALAAI